MAPVGLDGLDRGVRAANVGHHRCRISGGTIDGPPDGAIGCEEFQPSETYVCRGGVERGQYPESVGREEEWLDEHTNERNQFGVANEYELADDVWMKAVTTRTRDGGFVVSRSDISERMRSFSCSLIACF